MLRLLRWSWRGTLFVLRAVFIVLLLAIPVPVGELMVRLLDKYRKNQVTQTKRREEPP
jgi:hypothetical protein